MHDLAVLPRRFYARQADAVAADLLGCYLVAFRDGRKVGGRIVEVEAYGGPGDPASHAHRHPDGRAKVMFGRPGLTYVYFTYGMHHCLNAVTCPEGVAGGVLLRALEPRWGIGSMRRRTPTTLPEEKLCAGPARLCRALGIDRSDNQADLLDSHIRIVRDSSTAPKAQTSTRIGLSDDDGRQWRFYLDSSSLSRQQPPG